MHSNLYSLDLKMINTCTLEKIWDKFEEIDDKDNAKMQMLNITKEKLKYLSSS